MRNSHFTSRMVRLVLAASTLVAGLRLARAQQTPDDSAQALGAIHARSYNFITRRRDTVPNHNPYEFVILDSVRGNMDDSYEGMVVRRTILSGSENYMAPKNHTLDCGPRTTDCDRFQNARVLALELNTHAPVQVGGALDLGLNSHAPGDSVVMNLENHYTGYSRATDEGSRMLRMQMEPELGRWGGRLLSFDAPAATRAAPAANVSVRVHRCAGCDLNASAEGGAPMLNLTRAEPAGNATLMQVYAADRRFVELTVDRDLGGHLSHWTYLTRAVDSREHPEDCGAAPPVWSKLDPFIADEGGRGNRTALTCFTVGSTEGLAAGMVVVVGGDRSNPETTRVVERVDATHFLADARMPHAGPSPAGQTPAVPGEAVTWGGYAGFAAGFVADIAAPRDMSAAERERHGWSAPLCAFGNCNTTPLPLASLVMASLPGNRLVLYTDSEATGPNLNTFGLAANQPAAAAVFRARVRSGAVTGLERVNAGDYHQLQAAPNLRVNSGQMALPPPRLTIPGCKAQPTIHVAFDASMQVEASLDPARHGAGCPAGDAVPVEVESRYDNPLLLYPAALVYRAIEPGERRERLTGDEGFELWMPPTGDFRVGDEVIASTWPLQQVGDLEVMGRDYGLNSERFGPFNLWIFRGQSHAQPMIQIANETPGYRFFSDPAHNLAPTRDGGGYTPAPTGIAFSGAYSYVFDVQAEPRRDVTGAPGSFVRFSCPPSGLSAKPLCRQGVLYPFRLFTVASELTGSNAPEQSFTLDPVAHRWTLTLGGPGAVLHTDATLEAAGCRGCTLAGETAPLGGRPLEPGQCASASTHVAGAAVGSPVLASAADGSLPGGSFRVDAAVTAPDTVTVELCALLPGTPAAHAYRVRVVP